MMKKLLFSVLTATILLSGCAQVKSLGDGISRMAGDIQSMIEPLTMRDFCNIKAQDPSTAYNRYSGRKYLWEGILDGVKPDSGYNVLAIKDIDSTDKIYAKVYNYSGQAKGSRVKLEGKISQANFTAKNRYTCHILLDEGQLK